MKKTNRIYISQIYKSTFLCICIFLTFFSFRSQATHVIGGNMYYKCLGSNEYEITLEFRRDCYNGAVNAQFDDPLSIGIYDSEGQLATHLGVGGELLIPFSREDTLNEVLTSECKVLGSDVCVHRTTYIDTVTLPDNDIGYYLSFERCCRTGNLSNIVDPLQTGAAYWIYLSAKSLDECNSSARFKNWPSIYLCANEQLSFDHSAFDSDGDSLVYKICNPSLGASYDIPKPQPSNPPPYADVTFLPPYSISDLMGGTPLSIDPNTGIMTAIPILLGQYLIGVCVEEYRDGELLSVTRRDFEYNVRICIDEIIADFEAFPNPNCESLTTNFTNNSSDGDYTWYFDWPDETISTNDTNPYYTYAQAGSYEVILINQVGDCTDTMRMDVGVSTIGDPSADFEVEVSSCSNGFDITLSDLTFANQDLVHWDWTVTLHDITTKYSDANPNFILNGNDGAAAVDLIVTSESGCTDAVSKAVELQLVSFELAADTITICQGESVPLVSITDPNASYFWTPAHTLDLTDPTAPIASPIDNTTYQVFITAGACEYSELITIIVEDELNFELEIDDTFSCAEALRITIPGFEDQAFDWLDNSSFGQVLFIGDSFDFIPTAEGQYLYVRPSGSICLSLDSIWVQQRSFALEFNILANQQFCLGEEFAFQIYPSNENLTYSFDATSSLSLLSDDNQGSYIFKASSLGIQNINYTVINEFGCTATGVFSVKINDQIMQDIDDEIFICSDGFTILNPNANPNYSYFWTSTPSGLITNAHDASPQVTITENSSFEVAVSLDGSDACEANYTINAILLNPLSIEISDLETNYCSASEVRFMVASNFPNVSYIWLDTNGNEISNSDILLIEEIDDQEYTLMATNGYGCQVVESFSAKMYESLNLDLNIEDAIFCANQNLDLRPTVNGSASFEWYEDVNLISQDQNLIYKTIESTQLILKATSEDECIEELLINIEVYPNIDLTISGLEESYCYGSNLNLEASTKMDVEVKWFDDLDSLLFIGNSLDIELTEDTRIFARAQDSNGCSHQEAVFASVYDQIQFDFDVDSEIVFYCTDGSASVSAQSDGDLNFSWTNANGDTLSTLNILTYQPAGHEDIFVEAINQNGCKQTKTLKVMPYELAIELTQELIICEGEEVEIGVVNLDDFQELKFSWSPLDAINSDPFESEIFVSPSKNTIYQVVITNMDGCSWTEEVEVTISSFDPPIEIYTDTDKIAFGESVGLSTNQSLFYEYSWSPALELDDPMSDQPIATPTMPISTYLVSITNEDGCVDTASIKLQVRFPNCDESDVFVPNMFTPNDDGMNDLFRPKSVFIDEMNMVVFDRWGEKVFETNSPSGAWDGTFRGKKLNPDVFGYYLNVKCINGFEYKKRGNVTLVK